MRSMRRFALAVLPFVAVVGLAACGSDGESTASSSPSTVSAPTTTVAATTSVLPASTAVGQPIPIGQETTVVATTAGPGGTSTGSTTPGDSTGGGTTGGTSVPGGATATTVAGQTGTTAATTTTDPDVEPDDTSPNAGTPFCVFNAEVEEAGDKAVDDAAFITALRNDLYPRMDGWIGQAPNNDLRAAATTMRDATKQAIDSNTVDPFDSDEANEALLKIHLFCG